jgi:hypothetical protein
MYMRGKCGRQDRGKYSTKTIFECPYSWIKLDLNYEDKTIIAAISALREKGFIELVRKGGSMEDVKWPSKYLLSETWKPL